MAPRTRDSHTLVLYGQAWQGGGRGERLSGKRVIELRVKGVQKGLLVSPILERFPDALLLAMGDDGTDEDPRTLPLFHNGWRRHVSSHLL